jgi:hypothetical protein
MKNLLAAAAAACIAAGAHAQSLPEGFEISGEVSYSYSFDSGNSFALGIGEISVGYRYDLSADTAIGAGLRGVLFFGDFKGSDDVAFYAYVDYQNFRLSYGAIDNAASHFDWDFAAFENTYFNAIPIALAPIGNSAEFLFTTDIIRIDAGFSNFDLSASYSAELDIFSVAGQAQFGNTRVLAAYENFFAGLDGIATLGVNHQMGNFEFGGVVGYLIGDAPFDYVARIAATYHVNDALSIKVLYLPEVGFFDVDFYELSATYQLTEIFSLGGSVNGNGMGDSFYGITASAKF